MQQEKLSENEKKLKRVKKLKVVMNYYMRMKKRLAQSKINIKINE